MHCSVCKTVQVALYLTSYLPSTISPVLSFVVSANRAVRPPNREAISLSFLPHSSELELELELEFPGVSPLISGVHLAPYLALCFV